MHKAIARNKIEQTHKAKPRQTSSKHDRGIITTLVNRHITCKSIRDNNYFTEVDWADSKSRYRSMENACTFVGADSSK